MEYAHAHAHVSVVVLDEIGSIHPPVIPPKQASKRARFTTFYLTSSISSSSSSSSPFSLADPSISMTSFDCDRVGWDVAGEVAVAVAVAVVVGGSEFKDAVGWCLNGFSS